MAENQTQKKPEMKICGSVILLIFFTLFIAPLVYGLFMKAKATPIDPLPGYEYTTIQLFSLGNLKHLVENFKDLAEDLSNVIKGDTKTGVLAALGVTLALLSLLFFLIVFVVLLIKIISGFIKQRWVGAPLLLVGLLSIVCFFVLLMLIADGKVNPSDAISWLLKLSIPLGFATSLIGLILCKFGI
ncbi:Uncharacterised protein [Mycoplasmopsis californica]|uniref:Transmembrane protein n=1 Tax=Mycoplasmopsis equigenitalium TaxID=114883 RepID=A0ABY5J2F1_9BACT|nr:hypothetical protein [Mycoplasmopsis equigenitalium]UUD36701.1 hypothetical protein NPA09_02190 [Mycoplasmopsis equigenitalium]VEU70006.1 Uncharacterised protein [Mycoplasmopsis californica]